MAWIQFVKTGSPNKTAFTEWKPYDKKLEIMVFTEQLKIAKRVNLPVIIHNRKSTDDIMQIVKNEYDNGNLRGQFHSFSAGLKEAKECIDMGFYISFTGNITYKPNESTYTAYEIVKSTPAEHLLLETDTPYLPPVPYRGKRNEPSYLKYTAAKIAELKGIAAEQLSEITAMNAKKLYKL